VEFSFLLAVPTMLAATVYDLYKNGAIFSASQFNYLAVGFLTSFIVALASIKFLIRFLQNHTFIFFGVYRIVLVLVWIAIF
jgi:undecaprenyl-diphosphatase